MILKQISDIISRRKTILFIVLFVGLFILSIDIWNWNKTHPLVFGLPFWIVYHCGLTITAGIIFYVFSIYYWRDA